jgi:prevent-host-death family protein
MKSEEVRRNLGEVIQYVRTGGEVVVEHYNKPVARIVPIEEIMAHTADIGAENANWITNDPEMRAMLHGEVTNLGEGRIRISADAHAILSELGESADGAISGGRIWFEGDGYALTTTS